MSEILVESWSGSSVSYVDRGSCIDFKYVNELSIYNGKDKVFNVLDHIVTVILGPGDKPDTFLVAAKKGWEVITESSVVVQEHTEGLITVCSFLLS